MIEYSTGNMFTAEVDALVNTVNCVGVMGKGIALQCKRMYPANFRLYKQACDLNEVQLGKMYITGTNQKELVNWIINFPTKSHWRLPSQLEWIDAGLDDLITELQGRNYIRSIAIPPLGCGLGGLNWHDVHYRIVRAFRKLPDIEVLLYAPER